MAIVYKNKQLINWSNL